MAASTGQRGYVGTTEASINWRHNRHGPWEKQRRRSPVRDGGGSPGWWAMGIQEEIV